MLKIQATDNFFQVKWRLCKTVGKRPVNQRLIYKGTGALKETEAAQQVTKGTALKERSVSMALGFKKGVDMDKGTEFADDVAIKPGDYDLEFVTNLTLIVDERDKGMTLRAEESDKGWAEVDGKRMPACRIRFREDYTVSMLKGFHYVRNSAGKVVRATDGTADSQYTIDYLTGLSASSQRLVMRKAGSVKQERGPKPYTVEDDMQIVNDEIEVRFLEDCEVELIRLGKFVVRDARSGKAIDMVELAPVFQKKVEDFRPKVGRCIEKHNERLEEEYNERLNEYRRAVKEYNKRLTEFEKEKDKQMKKYQKELEKHNANQTRPENWQGPKYIGPKPPAKPVLKTPAKPKLVKSGEPAYPKLLPQADVVSDHSREYLADAGGERPGTIKVPHQFIENGVQNSMMIVDDMIPLESYDQFMASGNKVDTSKVVYIHKMKMVSIECNFTGRSSVPGVRRCGGAHNLKSLSPHI